MKKDGNDMAVVAREENRAGEGEREGGGRGGYAYYLLGRERACWGMERVCASKKIRGL